MSWEGLGRVLEDLVFLPFFFSAAAAKKVAVFFSSDQNSAVAQALTKAFSELYYTIKHFSLELHPEVEGIFFVGCRHRSSGLRPAISPAAL